MVLREGTHIINPALFLVMTEEATYAMSLDAKERALNDAEQREMESSGPASGIQAKSVKA